MSVTPLSRMWSPPADRDHRQRRKQLNRLIKQGTIPSGLSRPTALCVDENFSRMPKGTVHGPQTCNTRYSIPLFVYGQGDPHPLLNEGCAPLVGGEYSTASGRDLSAEPDERAN